MWRRGERLYALLVFGVVGLEALALGALVLAFSRRLFGQLDAASAYGALLQALLLTGLALLLLSGYILLYHGYTRLREEGDRRAYEAWLERFARALFQGESPPPPPWPRPALEALLALRENLKGEAAERASQWLRRAQPSWERVLRGRIYSRPARLETLEALAQARLPDTLDLILPYLANPDPVLRLAAARAGARVARGEGVWRLGEALLRAKLPRGALLEVVLLMRERALPLAHFLLVRGGPAERWVALEVIGRLRLRYLAKRVPPFLEDPDPELRSAALRALWHLRYRPKRREVALLASLRAEQEFLRLQAARLLGLYREDWARQALWRALYDPSFYVRRAAAEGLRRQDFTLLAKAAREHPDPYGRAMAFQVMREAVWALSPGSTSSTSS